MEYRPLSIDEIESLVQPTIRKQGWTELNLNEDPPTCLVMGALEEGKLVGFLVLQLFPMLGPAYVEIGHRDGTVTAGLLAKMGDVLAEARGYMVICDTETTERHAQHHKLTKLESPVYIG